MGKVKINISYISALGKVIADTEEKETMKEAQEYIEKNFQEISRHKLVPSSGTKEEDGMEYDVSTFTAFSLSQIEIIDYTDGKEKAVKVKTK